MQVDSTSATNLATSASAASSRSSLSQQDFLKIMMAELINQDPLEPLDNNQFLNQLTQMQTLEATTRLSEGISSLLLGQQISSAGVLIGRHVVGTSADGATITGLVERVVVQDGKVRLGIGENLLPLESVQEMTLGAPELT